MKIKTKYRKSPIKKKSKVCEPIVEFISIDETKSNKTQPYLVNSDIKLNEAICGDCLDVLKSYPGNCIDLVITSPPYFQQREYGKQGIGNEKTVEEYISNLLIIFKECIRVTKKTGAIVFNIGDKYINGNLLLIPYRFALAVQLETDVKLVNEVSWIKINPVPKQDPKKLISSKEPFFVFVKSDKYYFNKEAFMDFKDRYMNRNKSRNGNDIGKKYFNLIEKSGLTTTEKILAKKELTDVIQEVKEGKLHSFRMKIRGLHALPYGGQAGGRLTQINNKGFTIIKIHGNSIKRDIIESTVESIQGNIHPAVYPEYIIQEFIKLLTKENDVVLDPFLGSGTTSVAAKKLNRNFIGVEINPDYVAYALKRLSLVHPFQDLELFV